MTPRQIGAGRSFALVVQADLEETANLRALIPRELGTSGQKLHHVQAGMAGMVCHSGKNHFELRVEARFSGCITEKTISSSESLRGEYLEQRRR